MIKKCLQIFFLLFFNRLCAANSVIFAPLVQKAQTIKIKMKKSTLLLLMLAFAFTVNAQDDKDPKKTTKKIDLTGRAADHFVIQYGSDSWSGLPDSISTKGFSRHFNVYIMLDKPFKTNPKFSVAYGVGIGSSNIFFDKKYVDIKANATKLPFRTSVPNTDSGYFKKFKLTTIFLEAPIELRYYSNPENPNKSWKAAIGVKVGTLLKAYTKGKDLQTKAGQSVYGSTYISKESNKRFFNTTRLAATARIGFGAFSLDAGYQITQVIKEGFGPEVRPFSIGLTISGL